LSFSVFIFEVFYIALIRRTRNSCCRQIARHTNYNSKCSWGRKLMGTGGSGRCRKHKFQGGIVFHRKETFVAPLVAADTWPRRPPQA